jgi:hypothetical protein
MQLSPAALLRTAEQEHPLPVHVNAPNPRDGSALFTLYQFPLRGHHEALSISMCSHHRTAEELEFLE